jgi:hypothetical protein
MLCLFSRNIIDKTMCEVLWRNISDFYVHLRVEVAAVSGNRYGVVKTVDTHNTSLKLPVGVSPLQLVNLHRNRRYFVIKLHTWFCLSYFLKTNIKFIASINILWVSTVFTTPYLFPDTAATSTRKCT